MRLASFQDRRLVPPGGLSSISVAELICVPTADRRPQQDDYELFSRRVMRLPKTADPPSGLKATQVEQGLGRRRSDFGIIVG